MSIKKMDECWILVNYLPYSLSHTRLASCPCFKKLQPAPPFFFLSSSHRGQVVEIFRKVVFPALLVPVWNQFFDPAITFIAKKYSTKESPPRVEERDGENDCCDEGYGDDSYSNHFPFCRLARWCSRCIGNISNLNRGGGRYSARGFRGTSSCCRLSGRGRRLI